MKDNSALFGFIIVVLIAASGVFSGTKINNSAKKTERSPATKITSEKNEVLSKKEIDREVKKIESKVKAVQRQIDKEQEKKEASIYKGKVTISSLNARGLTNSGINFLTLSASRSNDENIPLTGWSIKSQTIGSLVYIGGAVYLPQKRNYISSEKPIVLEPGNKVYIYRGSSPMGASFRTNKCTGYFNEIVTQTPQLERLCPLPITKEMSIPTTHKNNESCMNYLKRVRRCDEPGVFPDNVGRSCRDFAVETLNYSSCVASESNKSEFYRPEWRVYLNNRYQLWDKEDDTIKLLDQFGKTVDSVSY